MSIDLTRTEANFSPNSIDSLCLRVALVSRASPSYAKSEKGSGIDIIHLVSNLCLCSAALGVIGGSQTQNDIAVASR